MIKRRTLLNIWNKVDYHLEENKDSKILLRQKNFVLEYFGCS